MTIYEAIEKRRSVREYREKEIDEQSLNRIMESARLAPSAHNSQEYKFVIVTDAEKKKQLAQACSDQRFIIKAPVIIVAVSLNPDYIMEGEVPAYAVDLAIALEHIALSAVEEGLGSCWIGSFSQKEVKQLLGIPEKYKVVALMPLGTPYEEPGVQSRKSLTQLICKETFSEITKD